MSRTLDGFLGISTTVQGVGTVGVGTGRLTGYLSATDEAHVPGTLYRVGSLEVSVAPSSATLNTGGRLTGMSTSQPT